MYGIVFQRRETRENLTAQYICKFSDEKWINVQNYIIMQITI